LYQWLKEFGFTAWQDIYALVESQSGKQVFSTEYRLIKPRYLSSCSNSNGTNADAFYIDEGVQDVKIPLNLSISKVSTRSTSSNTTIFVDKNKLFFL
jgi:tRNA(Ile)-lysidine synthase